MFAYYFGFFLIFYCVWFSTCQDVEISIDQGKLVGEWRKTFAGKSYAAFESIPYAKPPIGDRRFEPPQLPDSWDGVRQAKQITQICFQWSKFGTEPNPIIGDEDCLYLNIYTTNPDSDANLDVIFYIHGGSFIWGAAFFYGPHYLLNENLVLVTINYRLGPLGFLSTQDEVLPGNNGLKDQVMAMEWVRDNIKHFGGNPNSITAMGTSAGGASVNFHMVSPLSKGLFHKAVSQGGSACNPWSYQTRPKEKALEIGASLGCSIESSRALVDCLKTKPAQDIVKFVEYYMPLFQAPISTFGPVIEPENSEKAFLTDYPYVLSLKGEIADVPWISSFASEEGLFPVGMYIRFSELIDEMNVKWEELAPFLMIYNDTIPLEMHSTIGKKIRDAYFNEKDISLSTISDLINMFSDRLFNKGIQECAKAAASKKNTPVYFYEFLYPGENSFANFLSAATKKYGVAHGDDALYIVSMAFLNPLQTKEDIKMSEIMVKMIGSFINTGVPVIENTNWLPLDKNDDAYNLLMINGPNNYEMTNVKTTVHNKIWEEFNFKENGN